MTAHTTFDIADWIARFPWSVVRSVYKEHTDQKPSPRHITSPVDIVIAESLRAERGANPQNVSCVPVDIFTFGLGAPDDPSMTKVGGIPYRPADKPWPKHDNHNYFFLAQFNFADSRDVVGETPGEILLIFALGEDFSDFHFEWSNTGISNLPTLERIPSPAFEFVECFGVRHRTVDYPLNMRNLEWKLDVLEANKIGGLPAFHGLGLGWNDETNQPEEHIDDLDQLIEGRHICTLSAIQPNPFFDYPFINHPDCLTLKRYRERDKTLTLVDMGSLFVYLNDDGEINHYFQHG